MMKLHCSTTIWHTICLECFFIIGLPQCLESFILIMYVFMPHTHSFYHQLLMILQFINKLLGGCAWSVVFSCLLFCGCRISKEGKRPGLPITRGSPGSMVTSGSAAPGSYGYKKTLWPPRIMFQRWWRFPRAGERRQRCPRACERRRSRGLAAVARWGGRLGAMLLWRVGKHRRRSRTGRPTVAHPRPDGDDGCARRGRLWQQRQRILKEHTWQRIPEARARRRFLRGTRLGVALAGVPLPRWRWPSLGASDDDRLP
jgi:hypothetical protein